jgi:endo-1,4-beta-xylanase
MLFSFQIRVWKQSAAAFLLAGTFLFQYNHTLAQTKAPKNKAPKEAGKGTPTGSDKGLKDYFKNYFDMGVAVSPQSLKGPEAQLIREQFNSVTAENAMKMGPIHPEENRYNWEGADAIVNFAQAHNLKVRGHNLLWHQQTPNWLFKDAQGNTVSKDVLLKRLKDHITTVVTRYKGKIFAWDVVNEAIADDSTQFLRDTEWYRICGDEFLAKAFEYAHEADPQALLFYNDYNTERPEKRERVYRLLKQLVDAKVPIHGVGLQAHWSLSEPSEKQLRDAIERYSSLGLQLHFTEVDMSIYPWEKNRRERRADESDAFTPELEQKQLEQYKKVFRILREYNKVITSVTFWNISDKYTWLDTYPVRGRKNYPLLFDQNLKPKKVYWEVVKF